MTDTTTLLREAADTIAAMWDRHAGGKLNIASARTADVNRAQKALADLRAALAAPVEPVAQPVDASVPRADWEKMRDDLTRAKNLIVRLWNKHPEARAQIEGSTGSWFVWGQDRDATPPAQPAPAVQVVLRQPNLFAADPAAPAVNCEWTNCPRRVGDVCCNDRPAAPAVPAVDCRTCARCYATKGRGVYGCDSVVRCTNGDRYQPLPPVKLWRAA